MREDSELFRNTVAPVVERCDGIAFREEVADKSLTPQEPFCSGRGDRHDLFLYRPAHRPEMEIIRDFLFMIRVDIEVLALSLEFRRIP